MYKLYSLSLNLSTSFHPDQQLQTVPGCLRSRSGELQLRLLPGLLIPRPAEA